jgi:ABC-type transport system involved in cytochrome bd biosynthesis fused ATPase/permease subunit
MQKTVLNFAKSAHDFIRGRGRDLEAQGAATPDVGRVQADFDMEREDQPEYHHSWETKTMEVSHPQDAVQPELPHTSAGSENPARLPSKLSSGDGDFVVAVVGPAGAGKSSFIGLILGDEDFVQKQGRGEDCLS